MVEESGGKVTPAVQKFLEGVVKGIQETIPHILDEHKNDQGKLDYHYKAINDAIATLEAKKGSLEKTKVMIGAESPSGNQRFEVHGHSECSERFQCQVFLKSE